MLIGRSIASLLHSSIGIVVMALTGVIIGWRITTSVWEGTLGFILVLVFGFAMIWFGVMIGSWLRSVEAVNGFMFSVLFPLTFVSNAFVPTQAMQPWLRTIAEWNPISSLIQAMRVLWGNGPAAGADAALPLRYPELSTLIWAVVLTLLFMPFALRNYARRTTD